MKRWEFYNFLKCPVHNFNEFKNLQVQHYILVVQAQDNGKPSLSSTLTVYCNVLDLNDNAPVFDPMSYSNEILENVPIGSEVVTVSATDTDSGEWIENHSEVKHKFYIEKLKLSGDNGKIEYSITAGDDNEEFQVLPNGTIYTKKLLDRETKSSYNLIVMAKDCAEEDRRLSATVQVSLIH